MTDINEPKEVYKAERIVVGLILTVLLLPILVPLFIIIVGIKLINSIVKLFNRGDKIKTKRE